ncbi:sugar porter family MFS transporter [Priestia endophytica]|uniref:sugar porter family MFS transporter n=1 Tax=Priestia endophytica TaxID=135735 RepID=UPI00124CE458|nr:sugar porter family MFS transporter [Priestia endophytica]KAB2496069.1 sugar porter family MFS transporter [Priestia endophytica]
MDIKTTVVLEGVMKSKKAYISVIYFFGALGGLLFGYDTGVISGALLFIREDLGLTPFMEGLVVSGVLIGALIGAALCGPIADKIGRKKTIILLGVLFTIGAIGTGLAPNVEVLVLFRIFLGVPVGGASALVPLYLSEMAPAEIRGRVASLNTLMNALGILMAYIVNFAFATGGRWDWMLLLAVVPSVLLMVGMFFMPESPRWLLKQDREGDARKVLLLTRDAKLVEEEIKSIQEVKTAEKVPFSALFAPSVRPILFIGIGVAIFQQVIGTNTIIYYTPTILENAGFGASSAIAGTIGIGIVNLLFTIIGLVLIDKIGRRMLMLIGNVGMSIALVVLGISTLFFTAPGWLLLTCLCLFMVAYSASWGMVVWVVLAEIFPLRIRGTAIGLASTTLWLANIAVSLSFPVLLNAFGSGSLFLTYGAIGIFAFLFVYKFVPETKGKTLEEIEAEISSKKTIRSREVAVSIRK